jgi:isoquinoline 1-oxidoreductase beta subunit
MLKAVIARAPSFGAKVKSFDATRARAVKGVVEVEQVPSGVAVIAENTWAALKGREALQVEWDESAGQNVSTDGLRTEWRSLAAKPGTVGKDVGNVKNALANAARKIDVEYELPYLAHACMEPMNAAALVKDGRCTLWVGTQNQSQDLNLVAQALGIPPANVEFEHPIFGWRIRSPCEYALRLHRRSGARR